ncbi:MAG: MltA domain-containing protein [Planctomycetota bacterium]
MRFLLLLGLALVACRSAAVTGDGLLGDGASALIPLPAGEPFPDLAHEWEARDDVLESLALSLKWTRRKHAEQFFPVAGITHARALRSLERMQELLTEAGDAEAFQRAVEAEFVALRAAGLDGRGGGVLFTAYCTPVLPGSLTPSTLYRHPLYRLPPDLVKRKDGSVEGWSTAMGMLPWYPSRGAIERGDILEGRELELVWLADPIDAFLAHVNGSAFLRLDDGTMFKAGYAGKNGREYVSLGKELIEANVFEPGAANLAAIRAWASTVDASTRDEFLHRNTSYVFFTQIESNPHGSLDFPVRAERSLATDKSIFPRGALVFVETELAPDAEAPLEPYSRLMFDQDTGGAIRNAGRADIYLGIGDEAEARAGRTKSIGQMTYLFLAEG